MKSLICEHCGQPFKNKNTVQRCCSRRCARSQEAKRRYEPAVDRFWRSVDKTGDCWIWTGHRTAAGYGQLGNKNKSVYTHRFSWELHNGPIDPGTYICHHCDNPPCVRPDHLFMGTPKDNIEDMISKGRKRTPRYSRGSKHYHSKLTEAQVVAIRHRYAQGGIHQNELAALYETSNTNINSIIRRKSWTHV